MEAPPLPLAGIAFFVVWFLVLWVGIVWLTNHLGGWHDLAAHYRLDQPFTGQGWHRQTAELRWGMRCRRCLTVAANPAGLYLAVPFPFGLGTPALFIPWDDVSITTQRRLLWTQMELRFRQVPGVPLRIDERLGRRLAEAAGAAWPGDQQAPRPEEDMSPR
jgi:hypothetical protein